MTDLDDKSNPDPNLRPNPIQIDVFEVFYSSIHKYVDARIAYTKKAEESSLMNRLVDKINNAIKGLPTRPDVEKQLVGRIIELNQNASNVLNSLKKIKLDLMDDAGEELLPFIEAVMEPMIRDVMRIQNSLHDEKGIYKQAEAFKKYSEWVDRAKLWVGLCSTKKNKEAIIDAVIQHTMDDFSNMIDRDKRLIDDYLEYVLEYISCEEDQKECLIKCIRNSLTPYIKSLNNLKKRPLKLSLESLNGWKENSDTRRDRYYNGALQIIDNMVTQISPSVAVKYEHASLIGLLEQLVFLETEIPLLCERIANHDEIDVEVGLIASELLSFEQEVQELYFDVRMPPDAIERLKVLKDLLGKTFNKFKSSNQ